MLGREDPSLILRREDEAPVLEARPELGGELDPQRHASGIVFTTGVVEDGDDCILASGEDDLACRVTRVPKGQFI